MGRTKQLYLASVVAFLFVFSLLPSRAGAVACGDFVLQWGSQGSAAGEFDFPSGINVDSSGNVLVVDRGNKRIQRFSSTGSFISEFTVPDSTTAAAQPFDVAADASGDVYVADSGTNLVRKFNSGGTFLLNLGTGNEAGGSADGDFVSPRGITVGPSGLIYVVDGGNLRIQAFNTSGVFQFAWGSLGTGAGEFSGVVGVATDPSGNVYVAEPGNSRIQKFSSSGVFLAQWGAEANVVEVDGLGRVFSGDSGSGVITLSDSNGNPLTGWGMPGSGPGEFGEVSGIGTSAAGDIYVADDNHRVQKFVCPLDVFTPTPTPSPTPTPGPGAEDVTTFTLKKTGKGRETSQPIVGAEIRIFDRENPAFRSAYGSNPRVSQYGNIYNGGIGQISSCVTGISGTCTATEAAPGRYLVVGKFVDPEAPMGTVYAGRKKGRGDFRCSIGRHSDDNDDNDEDSDDNDDDNDGRGGRRTCTGVLRAVKNLKIEKKFNKNGTFRAYGPQGRVVVAGVPQRSLDAGSLVATLTIISALALVLFFRNDFGRRI